MTGRSGRGTARQTVRIDEDLWKLLGRLAAERGTDRSAVLRDFIRWTCGEPDAPEPYRLVNEVEGDPSDG
jgi:hypothetical protein